MARGPAAGANRYFDAIGHSHRDAHPNCDCDSGFDCYANCYPHSHRDRDADAHGYAHRDANCDCDPDRDCNANPYANSYGDCDTVAD